VRNLFSARAIQEKQTTAQSQQRASKEKFEWSRSQGSMTTAIVSSVIANKYLNGGNAWVVLSWVLGLKRLGLDVFFVEQIQQENCVDTTGRITAFENSVNLAYFKNIVDQFDLVGSAALICEGGEKSYGLTYAELCQVADAADLLINITGHLTLEPIKHRIRRRVYLDLDPGFTQFWHAMANPRARLEGHDFYFTIGENIGTSVCSIPTNGIEWRTTRQPIILNYWPVANSAQTRHFTTVASWRGPYGRLEFGAKSYGLKAHEFRKFIELPERVSRTFEIALDIHAAEENDLIALHRHGWQLVDLKSPPVIPRRFRVMCSSPMPNSQRHKGFMLKRTAAGSATAQFAILRRENQR
jgi:hypothetical protein